MADALLELQQVCKDYNVGRPNETRVLHDVDLVIEKGEFLALIGPSGSGKSTLLNIVGLLDRATSGRLAILGDDVAALGDTDLTRLRGRTIGFVFQYHMLISAFSAIENVRMPMLVSKGFTDAAMEVRARELIDLVGLTSVKDNLALNMSGGQQQRVAVARALAMRPDLVLADEPTGNLDTQSAEVVFDLMRDVNRKSGTTFMLVTHNMDLARRCDRIVEVVDGRIRTHLASPAARSAWGA